MMKPYKYQDHVWFKGKPKGTTTFQRFPSLAHTHDRQPTHPSFVEEPPFEEWAAC